uniref:Uncharacterized protein n=1 Tax=Strigamia maritima TaxID=126957 RepID=T1JL96_STRMM
MIKAVVQAINMRTRGTYLSYLAEQGLILFSSIVCYGISALLLSSLLASNLDYMKWLVCVVMTLQGVVVCVTILKDSDYLIYVGDMHWELKEKLIYSGNIVSFVRKCVFGQEICCVWLGNMLLLVSKYVAFGKICISVYTNKTNSINFSIISDAAFACLFSTLSLCLLKYESEVVMSSLTSRSGYFSKHRNRKVSNIGNRTLLTGEDVGQIYKQLGPL